MTTNANRPTERDGEYCAFCDQPALAAWGGQDRQVAVCHACAVKVLPALMADSISSVMVEDWDRSKRVFDQIESRFWRALVHRLIKERAGEAAR